MPATVDNNKYKRVLINLGCGPKTKETAWLDCDGSWNVLASQMPFGLGWFLRKIIGHGGSAFPEHVRYVNVTKRLPFSDMSADAVYFSHVLEHLHHDEGRHLFAETYRILKPNGVIRVLVPDTEYYITRYLAAKSSGVKQACFELNENLMFRPLTTEAGLLRKLYIAMTDFHSHKFMYDRAYMSECLASAGFTAIREVFYNESLINEIADVEQPTRIGPGLGFGFEAKRPASSAC